MRHCDLLLRLTSLLPCGAHLAYTACQLWSLCLSCLVLRRFRLGVFDPPERLPWADLGPADVGSKANEQLTLEAARKGVLRDVPCQIGWQGELNPNRSDALDAAVCRLKCASIACYQWQKLSSVDICGTLSLQTLQSANWPVT